MISRVGINIILACAITGAFVISLLPIHSHQGNKTLRLDNDLYDIDTDVSEILSISDNSWHDDTAGSTLSKVIIEILECLASGYQFQSEAAHKYLYFVFGPLHKTGFRIRRSTASRHN